MKPARLVPAGVALLLGLVTACTDTDGDPNGLGTPSPAPQPSTQTGRPGSPTTTPSPSAESSGPRRPGRPRVVGTIARGLEAPWGIAFLPDGSALVGERDTTRVLLVRDGRTRVVGRLGEAEPGGEAGLLGLAASPTYDRDRLVYAYLTTADDNRVVRMRYAGGRLGPPRPVLAGIPNGFIHDGGRLLFAPDGNLFVSTGETGNGALAQDRDSLGGKILRITPDGKPAPGNPRPGSPVWTMGHRNVQGLAFDGSGQLWASEFGQNTWDELNRIDRGRNYGWPVVEGKGDSGTRGYRDPYVQWRTSEASPSGLAFLDGSLWMASLRGERLWQIPVRGDGVGRPRDFFVGDYGRMRTVVVAPDGNLWVTTSNRDGRGNPAPQDDRILEVAPR
ncbi:MAG: PQQ-dependent sugar dehydrogenase [Nocardioidaceae bacterium]|nr:PQQ-dependent sugar dehydrogenase [Nocardioidaceae bacterium]NUS52885.1 PQQ-dependent sugar dehydrogenase [Nocardioidaceae bacterium]